MASRNTPTKPLTIDSAELPPKGPQIAAEHTPGSVADHLQLAMEAIGGEDYVQALAELNRAIIGANEMQLAECYALRGFVRLRMEQYGHAVDDCTQSIRRRGHDPETLSWRAAAQAEQGNWRQAFEDLDLARQANPINSRATSRTMQSYLQPALDAFQSRIQNGNDGAELFFDRGWIYLLLDQYDKAQRNFELAIDADDSLGGPYVGLARINLKLRQYEAAIRLASQAMQLDDQILYHALTCRAQAYAAAGQMAQGIEDITRLREKVGDSSEGLIRCANLRKQLGDFAGAVEDLNLAEELSPDLVTIKALRGEVYAEMRNYDIALEDFSRYLLSVPSDEKIWLRQAEIYLRQNELDLARQSYDRALQIDDICAAAYLGRAQVMSRMHNYSQALIESERALRLDSRNPTTHVIRGKIFEQQKQFKAALDEFDKAVELADDPNELAQALYLRGVTQYETGNAASAIDDFKRASQLRPTHAGTHIWRAATSAKLEDWPDVIEHLQHAITLRPSAAQQYRKLGKPVALKAIEQFNKLIRMRQATAEVYRNRGKAREFLGEIEDAISDFNISLSDENRDYATMIQRAQLYARQGDFDAAIGDLTKVIKRSDRNHRAYFARARALIDSGKPESALRDISRAIELAPAQSRYHVLRGDLFLAEGKVDPAIEDYTQAIVLDPNDHLAFRKRGNCYVKRQQLLHAIADLTRSAELFPGLAETHILRGQAYLKNAQLEQANADFERALAIDPTQVRAFVGRANYLAQDGSFEEGLIWLTKAMHRFEPDSRQTAELLMMRGKIFYQMGRFPPAISDFSAVIQLQRGDHRAVAAARCARAVVLVQHGDLIRAKKEFDRVLRRLPDHPVAQASSKWLSDGMGRRPAILQPPEQIVRPTRPPIIIEAPEFQATDPKWDSSPPFDLWIVRTSRRREYGPVPKTLLDDWVRQGRIDKKTRLLKTSWEKWRRASSIYHCLQDE